MPAGLPDLHRTVTVYVFPLTAVKRLWTPPLTCPQWS